MTRLLLPVFAGLILLSAGCGKQPAPPIRHRLSLAADRPGAAAHVAGKEFALPHEFKMRPGYYLFRIEKPGFAPAWFSCRVLPSGVQTAHVDEAGNVQWTALREKSHTVRLLPQGGSVLIMSKPETAEVVMGGRVLGSTPLVLTDQKVGRHAAQLRSPNHAETALNWEIKDARPVIIRAELRSNVGELRIDCVPKEARLYIDGRLVGDRMPYRAPIAAGKHLIRLEHDGYMPHHGHVLVELGKTVSEKYELAPSPGALSLNSVPSGAQVSVNGRVRGTTPLALRDIPAGSYRIRVELPGYDQEEETVEVAAGSQVARTYELASSRGGMELNVYPAGVTVYINGREIGKVEPGDGKTQTKLIRVGNLAPGVYVVKAIHKRANPEIRKIEVRKGQIARPARIELWVPNAEITWKDDGRSELGMIHGETEDAIFFGPQKGIRYSLEKRLLKNIKWLDINE